MSWTVEGLPVCMQSAGQPCTLMTLSTRSCRLSGMLCRRCKRRTSSRHLSSLSTAPQCLSWLLLLAPQPYPSSLTCWHSSSRGLHSWASLRTAAQQLQQLSLRHQASATVQRSSLRGKQELGQQMLQPQGSRRDQAQCMSSQLGTHTCAS